MRRALLITALAVALVVPRPGAAAERLSWETGEGKSYVIPALEIGGFLTGLNVFNRNVVDPKEYDSDGHSIWKNLREPVIIDKDPFSINQLGHPYQGNIYFGFARSAGLDFWRSLAYGLGGSFLWETAGEVTPPALNDHVNTTVGGAFIGEATFRMASLLLEGGGEKPGFWRELGAAIISPPTGFNRLVFGDRFDAGLPEPQPGDLHPLPARRHADPRRGQRHRQGCEAAGGHRGATPSPTAFPASPAMSTSVRSTTSTSSSPRSPTRAISSTPSKTCRSTGSSRAAATSSVTTFRGVWGVFGNFEYFSPQVFRVSSTAVSMGTVFQWWLARHVALQGTALGRPGARRGGYRRGPGRARLSLRADAAGPCSDSASSSASGRCWRRRAVSTTWPGPARIGRPA